VNRYLLQRGKGHALMHDYHGAADTARRHRLPDPSAGVLAVVIASFILGGLVVSIADELDGSGGSPHAASAATLVGR